MPRIRKKTSNRVKLKDRASIQKKVKETRRKRSKAAKKNVQWKSKTPKDPGIPNDFPYKDEILAEVAEQRRADAEEKEKKKAERQRARLGAAAAEDAQDDAMDVVDEEEPRKGKNKLDVGAEAIFALAAKSVNAELKTFEVEPEAMSEEEEEEDAPPLINRDLETLQSVLDEADVILEVIDARDPLETRSQALETYAAQKGKKLMLVVNKIDTCPREAVSSWLSQLRAQQTATFAFKSSSSFLPLLPGSQPPKGKGKSKAPIDDAVGTESVLACLGHWAKERGDKPLTVAVVGITNVGKTAVINSLSKGTSLPVYNQATTSRSATTTELPQEVTIDERIRIIDTPGLAFVYESEDENAGQSRARDILLRSRGRIDRLKDPAPPISHLVPRANHEDLMLLYSLPAFCKGDETAFLSGVARANQLVKKRGELDLAGASRIVLRDWSTGKFARYAVPPPPPPAAAKEAEKWLRELYVKADASALQTLVPRKEMRKATGLVRLTSGAVDAREIELTETWPGLEDSDDEESEGDDDDEFGGISMEVDEDEDEESDDEDDSEGDDDEAMDDDSEPEPPVQGKGKRKAASQAAARPAKKVAFAAKAMKQTAKRLSRPAADGEDPAPVLSSAMKKPAAAAKSKAQPAKPKVEAPKKVANKVVASKASKEKAADKDAYDFGKFFK